MELKEYTWYYDKEGRVWVVLAILTRNPRARKVWLLEKGFSEPKEYDFERVEELITSGKIKLFTKTKI